MKFAQEIECLIRARYPILYLVSSEEGRVGEVLIEVAQRRRKKLFEWSCTTGLVPAGTSVQSQRARHAPTRDPLAALDQVVDQVEPALFVFKDFHPFLARGQHAVIRRLREIALQLKHSAKTVILVSPVLEIPPELEKEVTVLHFPLPDLAELGQLLDRVVTEVACFENVKIELEDDGRDHLLQAALGLTLCEAENVLAKIIAKYERLSAGEIPEILEEKRQIVRQSGLLEYCTTRATLAQVGGLAGLKDWLRKRLLAFTPEARDFGLPPPKGVLLLGVQGCGKSLAAKAVAHLWQFPLLRFDMGRMFGSLVGSSEENVRRAIAVAESVAPAVLWIDEIDKAFAGTQCAAVIDGGTAARVFGTLLTWLSEKAAPVFVVATANDVSLLPPELLRKGRLDEIFFVDLPIAEERLEIFGIHFEKRGQEPGAFDLEALVKASQDFSGAEIEEAIISSLYDAFDTRSTLTTAHVLESLTSTAPLAHTMAEQVARLRGWADGRARWASRTPKVV